MAAWHPSAERKAKGTRGGLKGTSVCPPPTPFCLFTPMPPCLLFPTLTSPPLSFSPARHLHRIPAEDC